MLPGPAIRGTIGLMLELSPPRIGPGRRNAEITAEVVRDLTAADMELLRGERGIQPIPITRLRERHHTVARLIAEGRKAVEVAAITGMTQSRISILQSDPTFKELVIFYRGEVEARYVEMHDTLAGLSIDAAVKLREKLEASDEEGGDQLSIAQLIELTKLGADRTGHGPSSSTTVNVNVGLASRLEEARKRVAERRKMIDVTPQEAAE